MSRQTKIINQNRYRKPSGNLKACFLLILFCLMLINNIVYQHRHITPEGIVIVHAHPFPHKADGPSKGHHHTKEEYISLDRFFHSAFFSQAGSPANTIIPALTERPLFLPPQFLIYPGLSFVLTMRGPPFA